MTADTREDVFARWLSRCRFIGYAHGQELYDKLLDYAQGRFFLDSADADALLRKAEEAGVIRRVGKPEPKLSQRVAGVGGGAYSDKLTYPHLFGWEPVPQPPATLQVRSLRLVLVALALAGCGPDEGSWLHVIEGSYATPPGPTPSEMVREAFEAGKATCRAEVEAERLRAEIAEREIEVEMLRARVAKLGAR